MIRNNEMEEHKKILDDKELYQIHAYWRAANYLTVGQIYLADNPLLEEPLRIEHIKKLLLGHWGTSPGQSFIYAHLNRVIKKYDLNMLYISGPGHGGSLNNNHNHNHNYFYQHRTCYCCKYLC